jgi:hypothetical protein
MTKPLMMVSLPNSGSTWLAEMIAKHVPGLRYYDKEFFNPVCNLKYADKLSEFFGSELVECFRNIVSEDATGIDRVIEATWGNEEYTFDKECQSALKLPVFMRHFRCFVLLRDNPFPPSRARVWSFYEHAYWALHESDYAIEEEVTLVGRARAAHAWLRARLLHDAMRLEVPVLHYEALMRDDLAGLKARLSAAVGGKVEALAKAIIDSRRIPKVAA